MDYKLLLQIIGVVLGLLYLYLEIKASIWLWIVGIIMPAVHGFLYFKSGLYADFGMQVYYVLAGLWGLGAWLFSTNAGFGAKDSTAGICRTPSKAWIVLALVCAVLWVALYLVLVGFTDSTVPFWDALTTALSIVAMWMLSRKYLEQWLVWLVVDAVTVGLYLYKGIPLTAGLYLLYTILAYAGYRRWLRIPQNSLSTRSSTCSSTSSGRP